MSGPADAGRRAVFLDRDGVLNAAPVVDGTPRPPATAADVEVLPGVAEACARLVDAGWLLVVVTNQPDVARGTTTTAEVDAINAAVTDGLPIAEVVVCAHDDVDDCACRKPRPGMLVAAAERHGIDLGRSAVVGDRWRDVEAGRAAGVTTYFVDRGYAERRPEAPDAVVAGLPEAVDLILAGAAQPPPPPSPSPPPGPGSVDDWESHWATYAEAVEDNPAQAYRRDLIVDAVERAVGRPRRVVDVGSGQGDLLAALAQRWPDAELMGIELTAEGIRHAAAKVPGAAFHQVDLLAEPVPAAAEGWADAVVCSEVLEHVDDPSVLARAAARCLAPGGALVVTVPGGPRTAFDKHIGHRRHFRVARLRDALEGAGLEVEQVSGTGFPFFDLYKLIVLVRGKAVIRDVAASTPPSRLAATAMAAFARVLTIRLTSQHLGWQLRAVARPGPGADDVDRAIDPRLGGSGWTTS